jgi:hypothetical protein
MKILLSGILGGIVMFVWTSVAHMALPLGEAGIREIPNESAVLSAMQSNIGDQTGLYIFPGPGVGKDATRQEKNEAMKHMAEKNCRQPFRHSHVSRARPAVHTWQIAGRRICHRTGRSRFGRVPSGANPHCKFSGRVGFVVVAGILAAITTNISYWNWYGFPSVYTTSYMLIQFVGFFLVGIVAALILPKRASH